MTDKTSASRVAGIVIKTLLTVIIGGAIAGWAMDQLGLASSKKWSGPTLPMPIVSTRGQFRNAKMASGHDRYDYSVLGVLPGFSTSTDSPDDLLIIVHGFNNYPQEAANSCGRARDALLANNLDAQLVGYSWDANTQLDPMAMVGFHEGRVHAVGNGPKLARFIVDYKARNPNTRIHLLGYSLGSRLVLEALIALDEDPVIGELGIVLDSVHMVGASVDNEEVQTNHRYGRAIENTTRAFFNYYSIKDKVLGVLYLMKEGDRALGETDIENPNFAPSNYHGINAINELVLLDESGRERTKRRGDNHMGCLGIRDKNGKLLDDGVMNLVADNINNL